MQFQVSITQKINCDLARAFKTPILCDVSKIHTGFGIMPKITHVSHDQSWGKPGSSKRVYAQKNWIQNGGYVSMDHVIERDENKQWKIRVDDFQAWMLGFTSFHGTWETELLAENEILVRYSYQLIAKHWFLFPLQWLFANWFWKRYMNQVMRNIIQLIKTHEPYQYD